LQKAIEQFEKYITSKGLSANTRTAYKKDLMQLQDFLTKYFETREINLKEISKLYLRDYLRELSFEGRTNRTLARKATTIKNFFKFCEQENLISKNPAANLQIPKFEKKLPKHFTEKEMEDLLSIPDLSSKFGIRNKAILELIYSSGLRISEVAFCRLQDFDLTEKIVKLMGKGNKQRIVPVGKKHLSQ